MKIFSKKKIGIVFILIVFTFIFYSFGVQAAEVRWRFNTGSAIFSSPVVDDAGNIYFGNNDGVFRALSPAGDVLWETELQGDIKTRPALGEDRIYVSSNSGQLFALDYEGNIQWSLRVGRDKKMGHPLIYEDTVYVGGDFRIAAINKDGTEEWIYEVGEFNYILNEIDIDDQGRLYVGSNNGYLIRLSLEGEEMWRTEVSSDNYLNGPRVSEQGTVFVGSDDGEFRAINPEGEVLWSFRTPSRVMLTRPLIFEDKVFFGTVDRLFCLNHNGEEEWVYNLERRTYISSELLVDPAGEIFFGTSAGRMVALTADGEKNWEFSAGSGVSSTPAVTTDNIIYFGSRNGIFFAVN